MIEAVSRKPKAGDVIWVDRSVQGVPIFHCGIYAGGGCVIHFASPEGEDVSPERAVVHETDFESFKRGCPVWVIEYPNGCSAEETLRRARARIGHREYNLATNNCDHFATWCKTDEYRSVQVDVAKNEIKSFLAKAGVGGEFLGELICNLQKVEEDFKAQTLKGQDKYGMPKAIQDRLDTNSDLSNSMPIPESEEIQDGDKQIIDDDVYPELEKHNIEESAAKPSLGDRIVKRLKGIICAVAGAFEVVKHKLPWPISKIPYTTIATKVANVIDKVSIVIKVITGKLKMTTARDEMRNADTALFGTTIEKKMPGKVPVTELVRHTFGKAGACIKHLVQKTIATVFPKFRQAIKTGFQKITEAIKGFWERLTGKGKNPNKTTITDHLPTGSARPPRKR